MPKILVYGYYGKNAINLGDLLFKEAFRNLFPDFQFTFTDYLKQSDIDKSDAIFFGGGSFLYAEPRLETNININKPIFYLGVGIEEISQAHQELIKKAKLVAIRNQDGLEKVKLLNDNSYVIPDLVYSLPVSFTAPKEKSILIIPNIEVVPKYISPHYTHTSWEQFKSEFSQFLDELIEEKYKIDFAPMCSVSNLKDIGAMYEIVNMMKYRNYNHIELPLDIEGLTKLISSYECIITQRYHGIVLSEMCQRKCIAIAHHDKLYNKLSDSTISLSYFGLYKKQLRESFEKKIETAPIILNYFEEIKAKIIQLLQGS